MGDSFISHRLFKTVRIPRPVAMDPNFQTVFGVSGFKLCEIRKSDGFFNGTMMCKADGKTFKNFLNSVGVQRFLTTLANNENMQIGATFTRPMAAATPVRSTPKLINPSILRTVRQSGRYSFHGHA